MGSGISFTRRSEMATAIKFSFGSGGIHPRSPLFLFARGEQTRAAPAAGKLNVSRGRMQPLYSWMCLHPSFRS